MSRPHTFSFLALAALCQACATLLNASDGSPLSVVETEAEIRILDGEQLALAYQKEIVPPPEGVDKLFARSGFIHPLKTPKGGVVTSIHAPDHYHHMGLWHAWVKTRHGERSVDFWNVGDGSGGIRYARTEALDRRGQGTGFEVRQEHYARTDGGEEVILEELLQITARREGGAYLVDYNTLQRNVTESPLVLEAYRYGGPIAYRGPLHWDKSNSGYLTSEGLGRDGHATRARWVAMSGPTGVGAATVAILCHPSNRDAPQRVRIWDHGPVFFNYVPAQETGFSIEPGENLESRYRVVAHDGEPDPKRLEALWKRYAEEDVVSLSF